MRKFVRPTVNRVGPSVADFKAHSEACNREYESHKDIAARMMPANIVCAPSTGKFVGQLLVPREPMDGDRSYPPGENIIRVQIYRDGDVEFCHTLEQDAADFLIKKGFVEMAPQKRAPSPEPLKIERGAHGFPVSIEEIQNAKRPQLIKWLSAYKENGVKIPKGTGRIAWLKKPEAFTLVRDIYASTAV